MADEVRPLYYVGELTPIKRTQLIAAKQALHLDFKVLPREATSPCNARILALGVVPSFPADYALVRRPEALGDALRWVLSSGVDNRATTMDTWFSNVLQAPVKELVDLAEYWKVDADEHLGN